VISPVDVAIGASARLSGAAAAAARRARPVVEPAARVALHPPLVPTRLHPAQWLASVSREGAEQRVVIEDALARRLDELVPALLAEVLRRARLTDLVVRYVDLDQVVRAVDLDAAAARLDVEAVVDRVDVDAVAHRLDLDAVIDRLDLTSIVLEHVDLEAIIARILDRLDLVGLTEEVIDAVDLPEIIRESTGSMASDTVRTARMQGIAADEAIARAMDRLLLRHGRRSDSTHDLEDSTGSSR
jgi:hypothetical protein